MTLYDSAAKSRPADSAHDTADRDASKGLHVERIFSTEGIDPFDEQTWEKRSARICGDKGETIFEQHDVDVPAGWSQLATNVVVSKYFYGEVGTDQRESSVRDLVHRVARTIADWGRDDGIFASDTDAERFCDELAWLCVNQNAAFNSPVWFNVGLYHQRGVAGSEGNYHWDPKSQKAVKTLRSYEYPQASACFIQSVDDTMEDIMRLAASEAMLFKYGSGTGTDLSTLRSSREKLSGGGTPSGPLSFMRVFDQIAGVIKSGGKTRRAAKMQSLRCDHPDIREFITCKMDEEKKAWALIEQGYDGSFNGEAYSSVMYQNANTSIRVTDEFLKAVLDDGTWQTYEVTTGRPSVSYPARKLMNGIAEGTHICGDPGVQYHSTINRWHTCPNSGPINASNPCSEYMFVNDSACNLASLNLMKFRRPDGSFDVERFRAAVRVIIIAQEILVDHASYPSERICENSHAFRPLGLGYANLGCLLMSLGLPYDSELGRSYAAAVTSIMTATAYATSAELASRRGPFERFAENREAMLTVMRMHHAAADDLAVETCPANLVDAARACWDDAIAGGQRSGYRNAQATVLAPTGTIGFMMDCDTTGIEPDIALVKYKKLAGGGMFKIVNRTVPLALERLGYDDEQIQRIVDYIDAHDTIEGASDLAEEHLPVFDCAFRPANGTRCINHMGHIRMMGAVQPFLSGAISKTVNVANDVSVEEILNVYMEGWKLGLKAVAIYRDGSKRIQPLNVRKDEQEKADPLTLQIEAARREPHRHRLPATRPSVTHKFDIAGHEGYLNVGLYEDGSPGELFITMAKEGSTVGGLVDAFATAISLCLQYGVPPAALVKKFTHQRFEPNGMTTNREIPFAKSIVDYVFRWLGLTFIDEYRKANLPAGASDSSSMQSTSETVTDDGPSETGSAETGARTDADAPLGALFDRGRTGTYASESGGNGKTASGGGNGSGSAAGSGPLGTEAQAASSTATKVLADRQRRFSAAAGAEQMDAQFSYFQEDAPACDVCGAITVRNGNCYKCYNCGASLGCS
ncbi:MAG: vitamin B12-dependent ribonucleotide reductase [Phycisphaerae bacterium]|nr:vitamin B12-dependent ribonucleotide reductase [Phycisphaerae bacterium]